MTRENEIKFLRLCTGNFDSNMIQYEFCQDNGSIENSGALYPANMFADLTFDAFVELSLMQNGTEKSSFVYLFPGKMLAGNFMKRNQFHNDLVLKIDLQLPPMHSIDELMPIGKYKGIKLQDVYQGSIYLFHNVIPGYLSYMVASDKIDNPFKQSHFLYFASIDKIECNTIYVNDTETNSNWSKDLEMMFDHSQVTEKRYNESLLNKYYLSSIKEESNLFLPDGNPEYIQWLLENSASFKLDTDLLIKLQDLPVFEFVGIKVIKIDHVKYYYQPIFNQRLFLFSENAKGKNSNKIEVDYSDTSQPVEPLEPRYSDGYGGYLDEDFIRDALDGEPEAYWNID